MTRELFLAYLRLIAVAPDEAARKIVALGIGSSVLWPAFALFTVLGAIIVSLHSGLVLAAGGEAMAMPPTLVAVLEAARDRPLAVAAGQGLLFLALVHVLHRVGRAFGGTGDLRGALQVIVLVQAVGACLLLAQLLGLLLLPLVASLTGLLFFVFLLWHLPGLVMGLHGFTNRLAVLGMIVLSFLAIEIGLVD